MSVKGMRREIRRTLHSVSPAWRVWTMCAVVSVAVHIVQDAIDELFTLADDAAKECRQAQRGHEVCRVRRTPDALEDEDGPYVEETSQRDAPDGD